MIGPRGLTASLRAWRALIAIPLTVQLGRPALIALRFLAGLAIVASVWRPLAMLMWPAVDSSTGFGLRPGPNAYLAGTIRHQVLDTTGKLVFVAAPIIAVLGSGSRGRARRRLLALAPHGPFALVMGRFVAAASVVMLLVCSTLPVLSIGVWLGSLEPSAVILGILWVVAEALVPLALAVLLDLWLARPAFAVLLALGAGALLLDPLRGLGSHPAVQFYLGVPASGSPIWLQLATPVVFSLVILLLAHILAARVPALQRVAPPPMLVERSLREERAARPSEPAWARHPLLWVEWRRLRPVLGLSLGRMALGMAAFVLLLQLLPGARDSPLLHLTLTAFWCLGVLFTPLFWLAGRARLSESGRLYRRLLPASLAAKTAAEVGAPLLLSCVFLAGALTHAVVAAFGPLGPLRSALVLAGVSLSAGVFAVLAAAAPALARDWRPLGVAVLAAALAIVAASSFMPELHPFAYGPFGFLGGAGIDWFDAAVRRAAIEPRYLLGVPLLWIGLAVLAGAALPLSLARGPVRT